jgi:hypothetical protein
LARTIDEQDSMSRFAYYGFWACAGVYAAIGIIGVVLLGSQPGSAYSNDGYGTLQPAGPQIAHYRIADGGAGG